MDSEHQRRMYTNKTKKQLWNSACSLMHLILRMNKYRNLSLQDGEGLCLVDDVCVLESGLTFGIRASLSVPCLYPPL